MREEILEIISKVEIDCPDCKLILFSDEQYQCTTCGSSGKIDVLKYLNELYEN